MKKFVIGAFFAAQLFAPPSARAAEIAGGWQAEAPQRGAFAGARLRVPLGGKSEKARAGLALAAVERARSTGQSRIAPGLEYGFAQGRGVELAVAGRPLEELRGARKAGVSDLGWVAIGVGAVVVVGVIAAGAWFHHNINQPHD